MVFFRVFEFSILTTLKHFFFHLYIIENIQVLFHHFLKIGENKLVKSASLII